MFPFSFTALSLIGLNYQSGVEPPRDSSTKSHMSIGARLFYAHFGECSSGADPWQQHVHIERSLDNTVAYRVAIASSGKLAVSNPRSLDLGLITAAHMLCHNYRLVPFSSESRSYAADNGL